VVHDVGRAEREAEREAIPRVLEGYLAERESGVAAEMAALRAEMREAMGRQEALLAEIRTLRGELSARGDCAERPDVPGPPVDAGQP
jgi:hypothetical protein